MKRVVLTAIVAAIAGMNAAPSATVASVPKNYKLWLKIGRCEQPGRQWPGNIYWSHPGPTYQGGLGFYYATWDYYKPRGYPNNAGKATWRQQMRVANRIARSVGFNAWACWAKVR